MKDHARKVGVWLVGAYGDIATTLIVGVCAIRRELTSNIGLTTATPPIDQLDLAELSEFIVGGCDVVSRSVSEQAEAISDRSRTFSYKLLRQINSDLIRINENIEVTPEFSWNPSNPSNIAPGLMQLSGIARRQIKDFRVKHQLDHIVVVNVASAETQIPMSEAHDDYSSFKALLSSNRKDLVSPSMLSAYAAFKENCSFLNFTPNSGATVKALRHLAENKGLPYYGNDGKTGETLVKTALAPMFTMRNLRVMSWEGTNLLGNSDGKTLSTPENRAEKIQNKESVLPNLLGYPVHASVDINYVPSLGDWKTAWDLIHFQGFLDVPMSMQFTWQGCDSVLAAPLVIDMIRFAEFAFRNGESGTMNHLACFFKNPLDVEEHALHKQFEMLLNYSYQHLSQHSVKNLKSV